MPTAKISFLRSSWSGWSNKLSCVDDASRASASSYSGGAQLTRRKRNIVAGSLQVSYGVKGRRAGVVGAGPLHPKGRTWTDCDRSLPVPARADGKPGLRPGDGAMKAAVEADFHFAKVYATGRSGIEMCLAASSINALTRGETWRLVGYTA
jgi:hypothetical protein